MEESTRNRIIEALKEHESKSPSEFRENAQWRSDNREWLKWSRDIALSLIGYMEENDVSIDGLAELLDDTPQDIRKMLSGNVNFSLKDIAEIENKLHIKLLSIVKPE